MTHYGGCWLIPPIGIGSDRSLPRKFHIASGTPADGSRRRKEAEPLQGAVHPPPHVGGYEGWEKSGLAIERLAQVWREEARLQEK